MDAVNWFVDNIGVVLTVVGAAQAIAVVTPTPKDDVILVALRKILNLVAGNVGHSENAEKPPALKEVIERKKKAK